MDNDQPLATPYHTLSNVAKYKPAYLFFCLIPAIVKYRIVVVTNNLSCTHCVSDISGAIMSDQDKLNQLRHSAAHLLAHAITELFPDTQLTIGPATLEGFFYDFLPANRNFKEEDLPVIEERMRAIAQRNLALTH